MVNEHEDILRKDAEMRKQASGVGAQSQPSTLNPQLSSAPGSTRLEFIRRGAAVFAGASGLTLAGCAREETRPAADEEPEPTDLALVRWREVGRIETGFREARGLAVDPNGTVFVAGDSAIRSFDAKGAPVAEWPLPAPAGCIALGSGGALYAGLPDGVAVAPHGGPFAQQWEPVRPRVNITSIAVGSGGVWAANSAGRVVLRYDTSGRLLGRLGEKDTARGYPGLIVPSPYLRVAIHGGKVFVNNPGMHRVETWTANGVYRGAWGEAVSDITGFCGCCNPVAFAVLPDGRFVTAEKGLPRVKVYSAKGVFESVVAGPEAFAHDTFGLDVAADTRGRVLVLDPAARAVRVFAPV